MKPGQKDIFYITGSSKEQLEKSPFLERLTKKNYEGGAQVPREAELLECITYQKEPDNECVSYYEKMVRVPSLKKKKTMSLFRRSRGSPILQGLILINSNQRVKQKCEMLVRFFKLSRLGGADTFEI